MAARAFTSTTAPGDSNTPSASPSRFALTGNPLNLIIGRYAFNLEYQPAPHHSLMVTPHYDYLSGGLPSDGDCGGGSCTDTLNGGGAEIGYRFYSSTRGLDGFFGGPSLLIARHKLIFRNTSATHLLRVLKAGAQLAAQ
jgi:hypothetical protein